jgi:tripartite-type tricarboxylate transporter receptor subunit TctC
MTRANPRALLLSLSIAAAASCGAQGYPSKPVRLIVPFPPGGSTDLTARLVARKMQDAFGQPIVVENRAGANGLVGTDAAAKSAPDGYTFLLTDRGALGVNPSLYRKLPYDPLKDFDYVGISTLGLTVVAINSSLPARTLKEFVEHARTKPGAISYASLGVGSLAQLNMESLKRAMGLDLVHIPYKGAGPAAAAVASGEVGATVTGAPPLVPHIRDGRVRALALVAPQRWSLLPDVPTVTEAGLAPDTIVPSYFGFAAPAGTGAAIVGRLSTEARRGVMAPDVAEKVAAVGLTPLGGTPAEMTQSVRQDVARFAVLVKAIGIQPE